jgi:hypothetical protein
MAISWSNYTEYHRPSGLYYKMGRDGRGDPHLLCSGDEGSLRRESVVVHDHYWRRSGQWYVQVRKGSEQLLENNTAFDSIAPGVGRSLDEVLSKLGG